MELIERLRRESVKGASWYLEEALRALEEADRPEELAEAIRRVRPGMASLDVAALAVAEAAKAGVPPAEAARRLRAYVDEAQRRLGEVAEAFEMKCPAKIATISYSRAVSDFIKRKRKCIGVLYLAESRPGAEAAAALREYRSYGVRVVPLPDSALAAFSYDYAVSGLDGFYRDGYMFNKVGTLLLFAAARASGASSAAVFESYKMAPVESPEPHKTAAEALGEVVEIPLFDKFKAELVDIALTDLGPSRPGAALIDGAWRRLISYVTG